jgi:hypothetical protein
MFLRCSTRKKNGKEHRYWSIVENKRCAGHKVVQRHVLYLGEINDKCVLSHLSLKLNLPEQPPPKITQPKPTAN